MKSPTLLIAGLLLAAAAQAESPFNFERTPGKLPKDVVPREYTVTLSPDIEKLRFAGAAVIDLEVKKPVRRLVLNALNLDIERAVLHVDGRAPQELKADVDVKQQTVAFALPATLAKGKARLELNWHGPINREPNGWFFDRYRTEKGEKILLSTEMEPADARRLLPLWDEPAFRARFKLAVDLPSHFSAVSNMPVTKDEPLAGEKHRISFDLTPAMPSYLLVLSAGEFERSTVMQDGVTLGFVTTEGKQDITAHAKAATQDLLKFYNDYFGIAYPLPKLDQIAVPGGQGGAMENWGGIIYNEPILLWDPKRSGENARQSSYRVIAHEIAHQWFGNLVTMGWWDNLWLNEGFASWMAARATHSLHPEWRTWLNASKDVAKAMDLDARAGAHAIHRKIETEEQAAGAFDGITYEKGQAVLRMLEQWLGEDAFRTGLRRYMQKHQYGNTTSADLWAALTAASGKPVAKVAADWTEQAGFPLIEVGAACIKGQRHITLAQKPFRIDGTMAPAQRWRVPLTLALGEKREALLLEKDKLTIVRPGCDARLLIDPDNVGYFRVHYDSALAAALAQDFRSLPDEARMKLLADGWALVIAGREPLASFLAFMPAMREEARLALWSEALSGLMQLHTMAGDGAARPALEARIRALAGPAFARLGWDEKATDTNEERLLRPLLAATLARVGDEAVVEEGRARFTRALAEPDSIAGSMLGVVTTIAGRYADQAGWQQLRELGANAVRGEERLRYFRALAAARDPKLAQQTLQLALSDKLPPLIAGGILRDVAQSGHLPAAWSFAKLHGITIVKKLDPLAAIRYFPNIVANGSDPALAADLEAFVAKNASADSLAEAKRTANDIRARAALKARLLPQLEAALR